MGKHYTAKQIAAGFGGKAARSGKRRSGSGKKTTRGGSRKQKTFTVRALDLAAAGVMLEKLNAPAVVARGIAVATGQAKLSEQFPGAVHDVYVGAKSNWPTLLFVPAGLSLVRANVPTKTIKVPFVPIRVGA